VTVSPTGTVVTIDGAGIDEHLMQVRNGAINYVYADGADSPYLLANETGDVIEQYRYTAYGERTTIGGGGAILAQSAFGNEFGFQGHRQDALTGMVDMRNRWYAPSWGRFTSGDPIGIAGGSNLYAFVGSAPLRYSDPFGLSPAQLPRWQSMANNLFSGVTRVGTATVEFIRVNPNAQFGVGAVVGGIQGITPGGALADLGYLKFLANDMSPSFNLGKGVGQTAAGVTQILGGLGAAAGGAGAGVAGAVPSGGLSVVGGFAVAGVGVEVMANGAVAIGAGVANIATAIHQMNGLKDHLGEGPEVDAMHETGKSGAGMSEPPKHHVMPQEERAWFQKRGFKDELDIDNFTVQLSEAEHQAIHGGGSWRLGRSWTGEWNRRIMTRLNTAESALGRNLKSDEVFKIVLEEMDSYGIPANFVPYR
jgi:RHS repeat-associated protein